jgi:hypothetical protein
MARIPMKSKTRKKELNMWKIKSWLKYFLSFSKSDWKFGDYPIRANYQKVDSTESQGRFTPIPWTAQIINWWGMFGHGNTKEEALSDLQNKFEKYKLTHTLPRPGTKVPIEFASSTDIDQYEHIAARFFEKILEMDYYECLVTDESSLWDFHSDETNEKLNRKILDVNEVDVSDIENGNLVEIFKRIELLSNKF